MTVRPGTRWRATSRRHRGWVVRVVRAGGRSVEFVKVSRGHREPANKRSFMLADVFASVFVLERGA